MGLQEDDGEEQGVMTKSEFDALADQLLAETPTGREVQLSRSQGRYMYETRFKPDDIQL